ncbi:NAD-dependent epimerase/dehydratase family protein [Noviherbaspirillum sp.]|uniref:NAD-dependent epimerase/dehydratase family protein n=1 Tax=Noviherbaspirillum sp. TaxID=1926288 RepID=UPI002FE1BBC3
MQSHSTPGVLILGANGRFGSAVTNAFHNDGWRVFAQSRSPLRMPAHDVTAIICDALDTQAVLQAVSGQIDVVVNALNPPYTEWDRRVPALGQAALHLAGSTGALLMLPGNVYNFGSQLPAVLEEQTPQPADTPKGRIRLALEQAMRASAAQGTRSVVIRAGDFLGGTGPGTWMDMVIAKDLGKGRLVYPGPLGLEHAWAYLPDLAKVFVAVARRRDALPPHEVFHYGGLTSTGMAMTDALIHCAGRPLQVRQLPWWQLRLASPFSPMLRAIVEMRYLWQRPHRLSEDKLATLIGTVPRTELHEVMRAVLAGDGVIEKEAAPFHSPS